MKRWTLTMALLLALGAGPVQAHDAPAMSVVTTFDHALPNVPGKSLLVVEVTLPPGGSTPPHRHPSSAFIYGYVISGAIRNQVEGQPARDCHAGEGWYENPGAHHVLSKNLSQTQPVKFLAVFVVDTQGEKPLLTLDPAPKH